MPSQPPVQSQSARLSWAMLGVGLLVGFGAGYVFHTDQKARLGTCTTRDTMGVTSNVSQQSCQATCPTCTWSQN